MPPPPTGPNHINHSPMLKVEAERRLVIHMERIASRGIMLSILSLFDGIGMMVATGHSVPTGHKMAPI